MKKKAVRVLVDLERLRYQNSGIANVFRNLAIGFSELTSLIDKSSMYLFGPLAHLQTLNTRFSIVERKYFHKFIPFFSFKYDVIHTSHQLSSYFHFKRLGQKKVVTLHDLNFLHENISEKKHKKELKKVRKNVRNADVIVCISEFVKKDFVANKTLFSFDKEPKIEVVHNGVLFPDLEKKYDLGELSFLKEKKYILNIGVLFAKKNQLSLIKMLPFIEEDLVLVVSGENTLYAKKIQAEIVRLGVGNRVYFCHQISDEQKWGLIQNAKAMCHPSIAEGFGIPPIEAMYFGKPVFLSNLTSLPEIGGEVAFYFDSFETKSMVTAYRKGIDVFDADLLGVTKKLRKRALTFDHISMAKSYLKVYTKLFN